MSRIRINNGINVEDYFPFDSGVYDWNPAILEEIKAIMGPNAAEWHSGYWLDPDMRWAGWYNTVLTKTAVDAVYIKMRFGHRK
jgi:hypothetical protein